MKQDRMGVSAIEVAWNRFLVPNVEPQHYVQKSKFTFATDQVRV